MTFLSTKITEDLSQKSNGKRKTDDYAKLIKK